MLVYLQEAQELLGDAPIGESRSQTREIEKTGQEEEEEEEEEEEDEEEDGEGNGDGEQEEEVANLKRTHTMAETLEVTLCTTKWTSFVVVHLWLIDAF